MGSFCDLPNELLDQIFCHLFQHIVLRHRDSLNLPNGSSQVARLQIDAFPGQSIFQVNRKIGEEAKRAFFKYATFNLSFMERYWSSKLLSEDIVLIERVIVSAQQKNLDSIVKKKMLHKSSRALKRIHVINHPCCQRHAAFYGSEMTMNVIHRKKNALYEVFRGFKTKNVDDVAVSFILKRRVSGACVYCFVSVCKVISMWLIFYSHQSLLKSMDIEHA